MIEITFGKMSKRPNSTKRDMTDTRVENVCLKENTDLKSPVFIVNFDPSNYNYCAWLLPNSTYYRYYWIDKVVSVANNLFEAHCRLDRCATYRNDIINSYAKILYSNQSGHWDEYFDDLRFSPSNLDTYSFFSFEDDNTYLWKSASIFGNENVIDIDSEGHLYPDCGCYITNITSTGLVGIHGQAHGAGPHNVITNAVDFAALMDNFATADKSIFVTGNPFEAINSCIWLPFTVAAVKAAVGASHFYVKDLEVNGSLIATNVTFMPNIAIGQYRGHIDVPRDISSQPAWMDNDRWNDLQLYTPNGYTTLNLDYMYPRNHNQLNFATTVDFTTGDITVKYVYDVKGGWSDKEGTIAYVSSFNWGVDSMYLWDRSVNPQTEFNNSAATLVGGTVGGAIGMAAKYLAPEIHRVDSYGSGPSRLDTLLNTTELGMTRLRFKPFRCNELKSDSSTSYDYASPLEKYHRYCSLYGYPCNSFGKLDNFWTKKYDDGTYIVTEGSNITGITDGISTEDINELNNICNSGIWLR